MTYHKCEFMNPVVWKASQRSRFFRFFLQDRKRMFIHPNSRRSANFGDRGFVFLDHQRLPHPLLRPPQSDTHAAHLEEVTNVIERRRGGMKMNFPSFPFSAFIISPADEASDVTTTSKRVNKVIQNVTHCGPSRARTR